MSDLKRFFKAMFKEVPKKFLAPNSFNDLLDNLSKCYNINKQKLEEFYQISYLDDEEDQVILSNQSDFEQAVIFLSNQYKKNPNFNFKIMIVEKSFSDDENIGNYFPEKDSGTRSSMKIDFLEINPKDYKEEFHKSIQEISEIKESSPEEEANNIIRKNGDEAANKTLDNFMENIAENLEKGIIANDDPTELKATDAKSENVENAKIINNTEQIGEESKENHLEDFEPLDKLNERKANRSKNKKSNKKKAVSKEKKPKKEKVILEDNPPKVSEENINGQEDSKPESIVKPNIQGDSAISVSLKDELELLKSKREEIESEERKRNIFAKIRKAKRQSVAIESEKPKVKDNPCPELHSERNEDLNEVKAEVEVKPKDQSLIEVIEKNNIELENNNKEADQENFTLLKSNFNQDLKRNIMLDMSKVQDQLIENVLFTANKSLESFINEFKNSKEQIKGLINNGDKNFKLTKQDWGNQSIEIPVKLYMSKSIGNINSLFLAINPLKSEINSVCQMVRSSNIFRIRENEYEAIFLLEFNRTKVGLYKLFVSIINTETGRFLVEETELVVEIQKGNQLLEAAEKNYSDKADEMRIMYGLEGVDKETIIEALRHTSGNIENALPFLFK